MAHLHGPQLILLVSQLLYYGTLGKVSDFTLHLVSLMGKIPSKMNVSMNFCDLDLGVVKDPLLCYIVEGDARQSSSREGDTDPTSLIAIKLILA